MNVHFCSVVNKQEFADESSMQTKDNCGKLLATKETARRFLVQNPLPLGNLQQQLINWPGNAHFSLAIGC